MSMLSLCVYHDLYGSSCPSIGLTGKLTSWNNKSKQYWHARHMHTPKVIIASLVTALWVNILAESQLINI